jgi:hypothetical protein
VDNNQTPVTRLALEAVGHVVVRADGVARILREAGA